MPQIVGFLGSFSADLCLYAALTLQNTGCRVCVVDDSDDGILYSCIPKPDEGLHIVAYHNVDFIQREPSANWLELDYDVVFVQLGALPRATCLAVCHERILVTDCERVNLDFYNQFMQQSQLTMYVLLRGYCPDGISSRAFKERFEAKNCFVEKWLLLPLDEVDEAYRIDMQYGSFRRFSHISKGMEKVLVQLLHMLGDHTYAQILRAVRAAKKGKMLSYKR